MPTANQTPEPKAPHLLLVGGRFAETAHRPSGYIHKLAEALQQELPEGWTMQAINGGSYETLCTLVDTADSVSHLCWFADVPNHLAKLVPQLRDKNPGLLLTLSKNNRIGKYSPADLHERMLTAGAEWLVEFTESDSLILASLLTGAGRYALTGEAAIDVLARSMVADYLRLQQLHPPLDRALLPTTDSESFRTHDGTRETGIPLLSHPGAFGVARRNHVHEGVDLYAQDGTPVYAMEDGVVVYRGWFTGVPAGSPWWHNTECIMVQGASGALNYGELRVAPRMGPGFSVKKGQCLGHVSRVLREDKGRPRAMVHLERYADGTTEPVKEWPLATERPKQLCNPTPLLLAAKGK